MLSDAMAVATVAVSDLEVARHFFGEQFAQQPFHDRLADQRRHAVVTQAAGVNGWRDELATQSVHRKKRRHARDIAMVVSETALGHLGASRGLDGNDLDLGAVDLVQHKWE